MITEGKRRQPRAHQEGRGGDTSPPAPVSTGPTGWSTERGHVPPPLPTVRGCDHGRRASEVPTRAPPGPGMRRSRRSPRAGPNRARAAKASEVPSRAPAGPSCEVGRCEPRAGDNPDGGAAPPRSGEKTSRPAGRRSGPGPRGPGCEAARRGPRAGEGIPGGGAALSRSGAKTSRPAGRRSGPGPAGPGLRSGEARAARRGDPRRRRRALAERSGDGPAAGRPEKANPYSYRRDKQYGTSIVAGPVPTPATRPPAPPSADRRAGPAGPRGGGGGRVRRRRCHTRGGAGVPMHPCNWRAAARPRAAAGG